MLHYRVPLAIGDWMGNNLIALDNLDLPLLLGHSGEVIADGWSLLGCCANDGRSLAVQWLPGSAPSAVSGQRRGTLLLAAPAGAMPGEVHLLLRAGPPALQKDKDAVTIKESPDTLEIQIESKPFLTYHYNTKDAEVPRPYFHPVLGPTGKTITQMGEVPGKKEKHHWHTALWIAHQKFTDGNNWQIGKPFSRMEHVKFESVQSGPLAARFIEELRWLNVKGDRTVLKEVRTVTIPHRPTESRVLDIEVVLTAADAAVVLDKTPYHLLAVRVLDALLPKSGGAIVNSEGKKNPDDGLRAKWIDISGKLDGELQGVALFDHPKNLRHPPPCLQFDGQTIGLAPTHAEPYTLDAGKSLTLRYRVLIHAGDVDKGQVAKEYEAYEKEAKVRVGGPEHVTG
jgi:hypothetical protein